MSGSAALSAAKRRRAVSQPDNSSPPRNTKQRPKQLNTLQILNQHHMKLDVLYQRQDKINKILNIDDSDDGEDPQENIINRVNKLEKEITHKNPISNENELLEQINEFKTQIDELRKIILNVQSHSVNVSLELKKNIVNSETEKNNNMNNGNEDNSIDN